MSIGLRSMGAVGAAALSQSILRSAAVAMATPDDRRCEGDGIKITIELEEPICFQF